MTQERTEQRDFAKDREIIAAATPGPWRREGNLVIGYGKHLDRDVADCGIYNHPIDEANAIYTTESRTGWPAALDEIDRLNATIADLTAKVQERDEKISDLERSVDDREWVINERDKKIAYQRSKLAELDEADAWAEYWRREAFHNHPTQEAYDAVCKALEKYRARADAGDKEIERLKAKEARLIHEARGASEYALKEAEENAELREEIDRLREGFRKLRAVPNGRRNGKTAMIEEIANEYLKGAE